MIKLFVADKPSQYFLMRGELLLAKGITDQGIEAYGEISAYSCKITVWPRYFKRCDDQLYSGKLYFSSKGLVLGRGRWEVGKETQLKSGREEAHTEKGGIIKGTSMPP